MIVRYPALCIVFIFLFCAVPPAVAQATLPDITASAESGIVTIAWNSQYNGLNSIAILRGADSINYTAIGTVKKPAKGIQTYTDQHPLPGKNYYKLLIVFRTGLNWKTNYCSVYANLSGVPSLSNGHINDQSENHPITDDTDHPANPVILPALKKKDSLFAPPARIYPSKTIEKSIIEVQKTAPIRADYPPAGAPQKIKSTFPRFENDDLTAPLSIRSKYIFTDPVTGHINMSLPDDIAKHLYSVKFYDNKDLVVTEVPKISTPRIIIDKRNFQRKGIYRFVLRKDSLEIEGGYIVIAPDL